MGEAVIMEFDVWSNADGHLTATPAAREFVDDGDAPYSFSRHELRVDALNRRDALAQYHAAKRTARACALRGAQRL